MQLKKMKNTEVIKKIINSKAKYFYYNKKSIDFDKLVGVIASEKKKSFTVIKKNKSLFIKQI